MKQWLQYNRRMIKDSSWVMASQLIRIPIAIAISVILTRVLTVEDYGAYHLVLSYIAISSMFVLPAFTNSIVKGGAKGYDIIFPKVFRLSFCASIICSFVLALLGLFLYIGEYNKVLGLLLIVGSPMLLKIPLSFYQGLLIGKRRFALSRKFLIAESLIHLIGVGIVAIITKNILYVLFTSVIIGLGVSLYGYFVSKRLIMKCNQNKQMEKQLMALGWRMAFLGCFGLVSTRLEKIILGTMDPSLLATYHIGAIFPRTIKENVKNLISVPYTHWMKLDRLDNMSKLNKYWWFFIAIGVVFFIFILLTSDFIIPLLYSSAYNQSAMIAKWLSLSLIFIFFQTMISRFGLYQGSEKVVQYITIAGCVLRISLFIVFIPRFLVMGVIYSILLSEFVVFVAYLIWYMVALRKTKVRCQVQEISPKRV